MKSSSKHALVIVLIICLAILIGFAADAIWSIIDKTTHPTDYSEIIDRYSKEYNVPRAVIYAIIKTESDFDPYAESPQGAMGLMQMIPSTFEWLTGEEHLNEGLSYKKLYDPEVSIRYGTYYLAYLYRKFDCNWNTVFAAYNGGEGRVAKWLADSTYSDGKGNLTDIPIKETKQYVEKVNHALETYRKLYPDIRENLP